MKTSQLNIFGCTEYKEFLRANVAFHQDEYGYQTKLSNAAKCQKTHLSQVIHREAHLTPDQALALCQFWDLRSDEQDYFLFLLHKERAGTPALKVFYERKLSNLRKARSNLQDRFRDTETITDAERTQYYRHWLPSAVHGLVSIPEFSSAEKISKRLNVDIDQVERVLSLLKRLNIIETSAKGWKVTGKSIHLPRNAPLNVVHQQNWRTRGIENLARDVVEDIHYTALYALSRNDSERLRRLLLEMLDKSRAIVGPSKEEELVCINLDLFTI